MSKHIRNIAKWLWLHGVPPKSYWYRVWMALCARAWVDLEQLTQAEIIAKLESHDLIAK